MSNLARDVPGQPLPRQVALDAHASLAQVVHGGNAHKPVWLTIDQMLPQVSLGQRRRGLQENPGLVLPVAALDRRRPTTLTRRGRAEAKVRIDDHHDVWMRRRLDVRRLALLSVFNAAES